MGCWLLTQAHLYSLTLFPGIRVKQEEEGVGGEEGHQDRHIPLASLLSPSQVQTVPFSMANEQTDAQRQTHSSPRLARRVMEGLGFNPCSGDR